MNHVQMGYFCVDINFNLSAHFSCLTLSFMETKGLIFHGGFSEFQIIFHSTYNWHFFNQIPHFNQALKISNEPSQLIPESQLGEREWTTLSPLKFLCTITFDRPITPIYVNLLCYLEY